MCEQRIDEHNDDAVTADIQSKENTGLTIYKVTNAFHPSY